MLKRGRSFSLDATTIGDLEIIVVRQKKKNKIKPTASKPRGRHVKWDPEGDYTLIKEGTALQSTEDIDLLFKESKVEECLFYIFKHNNQSMERNETIPLYEAVYKCKDSGFYVRAQKKHLMMAYRKAGKCRKAKMWDIEEDGTPFCVDRHCFSMMGQRESKKRYESQKNKKS